MTPVRRVAVTLLALTTLAAHAKEVAPFRVDLLVRWGQGAGSDVFRDELARTLSARLAAGCFLGVTVVDQTAAESEADLEYVIVLSDVLDETRFDDTIAGAMNPDVPDAELRRVAHFEITVDATLETRANGATVHRKHMFAHGARRPIYPGEDPQAFAREDAAHDIVGTLARTLGCGSAKLTRKIREALAR